MKNGNSPKALENLDENNLFDQIANGVPEGISIDYKRDTYGGSDAQKKEFLEYVSSFANTNGGYLVIRWK